MYILIHNTEQALYGMGWSADGQLGQGKDDQCVPSKLRLMVQTDKLSTSTDFSLALDRNKQVWTWGNSEYGQGIQGRIIDRVNRWKCVYILRKTHEKAIDD